ncbi:MAG: hypothetical protein R3C44_05535 [Chloroflexota bacterium]
MPFVQAIPCARSAGSLPTTASFWFVLFSHLHWKQSCCSICTRGITSTAIADSLPRWAIVVAASLASYLVQQRQPVGLISNGVDPLRMQEDQREYDEVTGRLLFLQSSDEESLKYMASSIHPHSGRPQLMKVLEQLARIESTNTVPFAQWAPVYTGPELGCNHTGYFSQG